MQQTKYLAFDIETIPVDWDTLSDSQQEYILRGADTEEEQQLKKNYMGLSPITARAVCIGMQMAEYSGNGEYNIINKVAYSVRDSLDEEETVTEKLSTGDDCIFCTERKMLEIFWKILKKFQNIHLVSFNGRNFDAPFLMLRSALFGIRPSRNLMQGTKFNYMYHTDLIDELTFYIPSAIGATKRFNFDFYTRAFGISSPKDQGIDGSKVPDFFHEGRINEIAEYCLRDVTATWELYLKWDKYLHF